MSNSARKIDENDGVFDSANLDQLICQLKDALFDKYISNYLIKKADKIWNVYEKRLDRIAESDRLSIKCNENRPQTLIKLDEMLIERDDQIRMIRQNIENLCSTRNRHRDETTKKIIETQSSSIRVPKTPRCIDRSEIKSNMKLENNDEFERETIPNQETKSSNSRNRSNFRHCRFEHGEILSNESKKSFRIVRIRYSC